ncbi:MAG: magnesium transporter [Phycisphaerae bacterium]|nr:magnesium transporter [Phycisphaerae bacterium]
MHDEGPPMTRTSISHPWEELKRLAELGDASLLHQYFEGLSGGEAARALSRLSSELQTKVLTTLEPEDAADVIEEIPEAQAVDLVEHLSADDAAAILTAMPSDEQADLIAAMRDDDAEAILSELSPQEASEVRTLADYASDVAGGLMVTEFLSYAETATVGDVVNALQSGAEEYAGYVVQYLYITSERGSLVGVLPLRDVVLARPSRAVAELMVSEPLSVVDSTPLDDLSDIFDRHELLGVPVVDSSDRLVGVVKRHDVEEAFAERADSDYLKSQGIVGGEELRSMPLWRRSRRRLSWLSINVILNIAAASVIALYHDTLTSVIALAVFLPIISDMSGCSGNQAVAVSIRELTLGLVRPGELVRVWTKEVAVGAINGLVLGVIVACAAWLWKGNAFLGLVVGSALALNTVFAVSIGGTVPLILKRFRVDPALASGPVLTTLTDMCGFFLVLSLATLALSRLAG